MSSDEGQESSPSVGSRSESSARYSLPSLSERLALQIPKPKDWQALQRKCVFLFQKLVNDPHLAEYGRLGQGQKGIDLIGRRDGSHERFVAVQCRSVVKPLTKEVINSDCREAVTLERNLCEIIFATTAPDDVKADDAAREVEAELRVEGYDVRVVVYGWGQMERLISIHEDMYALFSGMKKIEGDQPISLDGIKEANRKLDKLLSHHESENSIQIPSEIPTSFESNSEDPVLHARIDTLRDIFQAGQPEVAESQFRALLDQAASSNFRMANFRIKTNLGSIALALGRNAEGAELYKAAYDEMPDDPRAIANLSLARTLEGEYDEAMELARRALTATPRPDHAVGYLLQAAARSTWKGEPTSLIPPDLAGSVDADLGLAEYLRIRKAPAWAYRVLDLSRRHPETPIMKMIGAYAILFLITEDETYLRGGKSAISLQEINDAADTIKAVAEKFLAYSAVHSDDVLSKVHNACIILRLISRFKEAEHLLTLCIAKYGANSGLLRILAIVQGMQGRHEEAAETLTKAPDDPEAQLMSAEFVANKDPKAALKLLLEVDDSRLDRKSQEVRWMLTAEIALRTGDKEIYDRAISCLRDLGAPSAVIDLLAIEAATQSNIAHDEIVAALKKLAQDLPTDSDLGTRFMVAERLDREGMPLEASRVLEGHADLSRRNPSAILYLKSLAASRRDNAFRAAFEEACDELQGDTELLWTSSAHAWNSGDLPRSLSEIEKFLRIRPQNFAAIILKLELLVRLDLLNELRAELALPLETAVGGSLEDRFRLATFLSLFDNVDRAIKMAYRLFLENRDQSRAWMTFWVFMLELGQHKQNSERWSMDRVAPDAAVDVRYDDGEQKSFIVELDPEIRRIDDMAWEPGHETVAAVLGKLEGETFATAGGRTGLVQRIRHKYIARMVYVADHIQARFPTFDGFRKIEFEPDREGGLDEFVSELKHHREWLASEVQQYADGPMPLIMLANRMGMDTIEAAGAVRELGMLLKVQLGSEAERDAMITQINAAENGCVLNLWSFWLAWRLKALDAIVSTAGKIAMSQSVMDALRARREKYGVGGDGGLKTASYRNGSMVINELSSEDVETAKADIDLAIGWANTNALIAPVTTGDDLPDELIEHIRDGNPNIFDDILVAHGRKCLLVSDDAPMREAAESLGVLSSTSLFNVFHAAYNRGTIDSETFVRWSAALIDSGQNYIGVNAKMLMDALNADLAQGQTTPGWQLRSIGLSIGGRHAELSSHVRVVIGFIGMLWSLNGMSAAAQPATGFILERLVRSRTSDFGLLLKAVARPFVRHPEVTKYIAEWIRGHFLERIFAAQVRQHLPSERSTQRGVRR
jgi:tetratricopeptide (TPR) repeat protein